MWTCLMEFFFFWNFSFEKIFNTRNMFQFQFNSLQFWIWSDMLMTTSSNNKNVIISTIRLRERERGMNLMWDHNIKKIGWNIFQGYPITTSRELNGVVNGDHFEWFIKIFPILFFKIKLNWIVYAIEMMFDDDKYYLNNKYTRQTNKPMQSITIQSSIFKVRK